jgi:hypothetical protein
VSDERVEPYFAIPFDGWNDAMADLQAMLPADGQLPKLLAVADLRWWCRRVLGSQAATFGRVSMPSARTFAARWNWGEKRARLLMADEVLWCDPRDLERWKDWRAANVRQVKGEPDVEPTPNVEAQGRTEAAPEKQAGKEKDHTRDEVTPTLTLTPTPTEKAPRGKRTKKPETDTDPLAADIPGLLAHYGTCFPGDRPTVGEWDGMRRQVRLGATVADIKAYLTGLATHPKGQWWRDNGAAQGKGPWRDDKFGALLREFKRTTSTGGAYVRPPGDDLPNHSPIDDKDIPW